jgi:hypothetical protein
MCVVAIKGPFAVSCLNRWQTFQPPTQVGFKDER